MTMNSCVTSAQHVAGGVSALASAPDLGERIRPGAACWGSQERANEPPRRNPVMQSTPRYWVPEAEVAARLAAKGWTRGWLMGWRDITSAHVLRTVIAAVLPRVGVNHKTPLFFVAKPPALAAALLGNCESIALDYVARQKVGWTSLTYFYMKQFAFLPPSTYTPADPAFIVPRVLELTYTSHSMAPFARDLGYEGKPSAWNEDRRAHLRAELDAHIV